jgi:predicted amidohydrolase
MAPMHKVAVIQLDAEPLQIEANFSKATSYIRSAAAEGASLAVLPEYHLTSWVPDTDGFLELCDLWEIYLRKYQALARELRICIAPGTIVKRVRDTAGGDWKLFNVAYFLDENGNILGEYTKKNLW